MDLTNKKPWESYEETSLRKHFSLKKRLMDRGWPHNFERKTAIRSKTHRRKSALLKRSLCTDVPPEGGGTSVHRLLKQNNKEEKEILPFVTQYKPVVSIIMKKCNLIQNQPLPCQSFKEPLNPRTSTQNHIPRHGTRRGEMEPLSGGSRSPSDKRGGGGLQKNFFRPLGPHFGRKIRGALPWIRHWPSSEFLIRCSISKRFCLHWKAFDLLNKMRYILSKRLLCPVVDRETKFAFTTKGLVILSVLMIFI